MINAWADHDSPADPRDEDGDGDERTVLTYRLTNATRAEYSLDGAPYVAVPSSPAVITVSARQEPHKILLRAVGDATPAAATLTVCPQAGCAKKRRKGRTVVLDLARRLFQVRGSVRFGSMQTTPQVPGLRLPG